jgi:hypothetical protein
MSVDVVSQKMADGLTISSPRRVGVFWELSVEYMSHFLDLVDQLELAEVDNDLKLQRLSYIGTYQAYDPPKAMHHHNGFTPFHLVRWGCWGW